MVLEPVNNLAEAEAFLFNGLPKSPKTLFKHGKGIQRSRQFFELLGNPQNNLRAIHIAATSGKGSTSHILDELLRAHGKTVGLHVSPHVYDYRERMIVNGKLISENVLVETLNSILPAIQKMDASEAGRPTYFEVSNGLAFSIFSNQGLDYSVIETGLGGMNDSTNTSERDDKGAVIGQIGEDHVDILADPGQLIDAHADGLIPESFINLPTIVERIAVQKAGIIPFGGTVLALSQDPAVNKIFEDMAAFRNAKLHWVKRRDLLGVPFNLPGDFQLDNLALALSALEYIAERDGWQVSDDAIRLALGKVVLPGRFEVRKYKDKMMILDGSHNPQKMKALVEAFEQRCPNQQATIILAIGSTKDAEATLKELSPIAQHIICTDFFTNRQDFKTAAVRPVELAAMAKRCTNAKVTIASSHQNALDQAVSSESDILLLTGSFYFLGEINTLLV